MIALQMKIHFFRPQASEIIPVTSEPTNIPAKKQDCIVAPRNARLQIKFHLNINEKKGYDYLIEIILGQPSVRLPQCLSAFMLVLRLPLCPSVYQIICLFVSRVYARLTYLLVCLSVCWPACAHGHTYMFGLAKPLFTPLPPPPLIPRKKFYLRHGALKRSHKFISVTSVATFPCLARDIWCDTLKLRSTKTKH